MPIPQLRLKRNSFGIGTVIFFLALWFILSFWSELTQVTQLLLDIIKKSLDIEISARSGGALRSFLIVTFNLMFGFGLMTATWLILTASQSILPTTNIQEKYRAAWHLIMHILGNHGPAIFINNGKENASALDKRRTGAGVIVIDFNSAVVLEQLVPPPRLMRPFQILSNFFLQILGLKDPPEAHIAARQSTQRVCGPGVVFTHNLERIRGAIDLRRQSRFTSEIRAYTSDGIELKTGIWTLFTAGQKPECLQVIYQGERHPDNLKAVSLHTFPDGKIKLKILPTDELDDDDRMSIFKATSRGIVRAGYSTLKEPPLLPEYDPERVFAAISSKAHHTQTGLIEWDQLPLQVAVDMFRELLLQINYDRLYTPDEKGLYLVPELKRRFNNCLRNSGLLSYRMIFPKSSNNQTILTDGIYHPNDFLVTPVSPLPNNEKKVLRERGIKIIAAGFLDLIPISDVIYQQRLDNWRAYWDKDTVVARAQFDLDVTRTRFEAYVQARADLEDEFSALIKQNAQQYSQEALTMRIFQALDSVAADPKTRQLLPAETLHLLKSLHTWLLPGENTPPYLTQQFDS